MLGLRAWQSGTSMDAERQVRSSLIRVVWGTYWDVLPAAWLPEDLVWDYVIQLVSALRLIHSNGLALRCIDATKVLLTGQHRSCVCAVMGSVSHSCCGHLM